jgi:Glycosyltransferase family 87
MTVAAASSSRRFGAAAPLVAVLVVGVAARAILVPITHGADFVVWDLASQATLKGINVYAHHPAYAGGPYAYFPLFLYVEVPMQWLTIHTGVSFTVMGKLPIVGADLLATVLIVGEVRRRGRGGGAEAIAAALFFLNPLVLYNGAFYGRFDSVCVALYMVAFRAYRPGRPATWRFAMWYALAVAAKTFPIFVLPWLVTRGRVTALRVLVACGSIMAALSAPYLLTSPRAFARDLLYSADKLSGGLSWQVIFHGLPTAVQLSIAAALLVVFLVAVIALCLVDDFAICSVVAPLLFIVLSKQVIEQYLVWPMPLLALVVVTERSRSAWFLLASLTGAGMLVNAYYHPFGVQPAAINVVFAVLVCAGVVGLLSTDRRRPAPNGGPGARVSWRGARDGRRFAWPGRLATWSASARPWHAPPSTRPAR